jgi:phosphoribosyl-ATP pyrophosphohydrolase/phosphoribosyl-AMP cyclohydrolase
MTSSAPQEIRFDAAGLVPAVVQDAHTRRVLMVGFMNREALDRTLESGLAWFWSRSRGRLWQKGESSGHVLRVVRVSADCDGDALLVEADPVGPTCHTNQTTCFHNPLLGEPASDLAGVPTELFRTIAGRKIAPPPGSYVAGLFEGGVDRIAKKVGEEASEVIIAAKNGDQAELTREMADLWFHCYVLLAHAELTPDAIWEELARRRRERRDARS